MGVMGKPIAFAQDSPSVEQFIVSRNADGLLMRLCQ